jgi:hypothetical protein
VNRDLHDDASASPAVGHGADARPNLAAEYYERDDPELIAMALLQGDAEMAGAPLWWQEAAKCGHAGTHRGLAAFSGRRVGDALRRPSVRGQEH